MNGRQPSVAGSAVAPLFVAHLALIVFSTTALTTFLKGPPGEWLQREPNATVMRLGWMLSGPTYVVLGALACLAFARSILGRRAWALLAVASLVSLGAELLGTATGLPFGEYRYTPLLGYRILGLVPFPIPISWFYMVFCSVAIAARWRGRAAARGSWQLAAVAGAVLLAWDVSMDPAMVTTGHWVWGRGDALAAAGLPAIVDAFFTHPVFYGMPLSNWLGWYLTGTLIARLMLAIVPASRFADSVAPSVFPVLLYLANGIMPVALCLRDGLWWAGTLGAVAMLAPALLALTRAPQRATEPARRAGPAASGAGASA